MDLKSARMPFRFLKPLPRAWQESGAHLPSELNRSPRCLIVPVKTGPCLLIGTAQRTTEGTLLHQVSNAPRAGSGFGAAVRGAERHLWPQVSQPKLAPVTSAPSAHPGQQRHGGRDRDRPLCPRPPPGPAQPALTAPGRRGARAGAAAAAVAGLPAAPRSSRTRSRDGERWLRAVLPRLPNRPVSAPPSPALPEEGAGPPLGAGGAAGGQPGGQLWGQLWGQPGEQLCGQPGGQPGGRLRTSGRAGQRERAELPRPNQSAPQSQGPARAGVPPAGLPTASRLLLGL